MPHKHINSKDQQPRVNKITRTEVPVAKRIRATMLYEEDGYTKKELSERTSVTPTSVVNVAKRAREHAIKNRLPLDDISNYQQNTRTGRPCALTKEEGDDLYDSVVSTREDRDKDVLTHIKQQAIKISESTFKLIVYDRGYARRKQDRR